MLFVLNGVVSPALDRLLRPVIDTITTNVNLVTGIILGAILAWFYHWAFGGRSLMKSFRDRLRDKDDLINSYKAMVHGELEKIQVDKIHEAFFKRLKRFFKKGKLAKSTR